MGIAHVARGMVNVINGEEEGQRYHGVERLAKEKDGGGRMMDERKQNVQCNSELEDSKMKRRSSCTGQTHKRRYQKLRKINANFNQHENPAMMIYSSKRNVDLCELVAKYSHIF